MNIPLVFSPFYDLWTIRLFPVLRYGCYEHSFGAYMCTFLSDVFKYDQYKVVIQDDFTNLHTYQQWMRVHLFPYLLAVSIVSAF